jgi:hypothetical protein
MLGHLQIQKCHLPKSYQSQYWLAYCSICASLRNTQGLGYGLLLNNEMTLVLLAFYPYWANDETGGQKTKTLCPANLFLVEKDTVQHHAILLASQFSTLLAWLKTTDSQTDQPSITKKWLLKTLTAKIQSMNWQLSPILQIVVAEYLEVIKTNDRDFEKVKKQSGSLAKYIALEIGTTLSIPQEELIVWSNLFAKIGEIIAISDHLIDLQKDIAQNQYNPIIDYANTQNISLLKSYQYFNNLFRVAKQDLLSDKIYQNQASVFAILFPSVLHNLSSQIHKQKPNWIISPETIATTPIAQTAVCDCGGDCIGECCCECCCSDCNCDCSNSKNKRNKSWCCCINCWDSCFGCDDEEGRPCWDSKRRNR